MNASKSQERCFTTADYNFKIFNLTFGYSGFIKKIPNKDVFKRTGAVRPDVFLWLKTTGQSAMKTTQEWELALSIEVKFFRIRSLIILAANFV